MEYPTGILQIHPNLYIDYNNHGLCSFRDEWIHTELPQKIFDILVVFAANPNQNITHNQFMDKIWINSSREVTKKVSFLRSCIAEMTSPDAAAAMIVTAPKGYSSYSFHPQSLEHFDSLDSVFAAADSAEAASSPSEDWMEAELAHANMLESNGQYERALAIHRDLARRGCARSINRLGVCYCKGEHVPQIIPLGIQKYREAAALNYPAAQLNLGDYHMNSLLGEYAPEKAFALYRQAASHPSQPDEDAMFRLYICLKNGLGTDPDPIEAERWRAMAVDHGFQRYTNFYQVGLVNLDATPLVAGDTLLKYVSPPVYCRLINQRTGEETQLRTPLLLAGCDPDICSLLLKGSADSRHALIRFHSEQVILLDLHSSSGTFINGKKLPPLAETILHADDVICFGEERFLVSLQ